MTSIDTILVGVAAIVTAGTPGFLAWLQTRKIHTLVNSRLTELLQLTRDSSKAEGKLEAHAEVEEQKRVAGQ